MNSTKELIFEKKNLGLGKRKRSVARVFLIQGKGDILINNIPGEQYLQYNNTYMSSVWGPLHRLNLDEQFDIIALVKGGGLTSQAEAIQLAVSRLLCEMDPENRLVLKPFSFLTRDARIKERKKYGLRKARKAPQYSKR
jgi:small subunit ribosomal protein S9